MAFVAHPLDRRRASLSLEPEPLGEGGQGTVTRVAGFGRLVYKEYTPQAGAVNDRALADLVNFGDNLAPTERHLLLGVCAWPVARVHDGDRITGFLMHEIPAEFLRDIGGASTPVEARYLLFQPGRAGQDLRQPDIAGRTGIALAAARLVDLLHGHGFVLGDLSSRNLLWQPAPPYKIFVLDCDGFRRHGGEPVLRQAHTPGWDDPLQPSTGPDLDTDRYKLALLMGRVLACDAHVRPGKELTLLPGLEPQTAHAVAELFARAAGPVGTRPIAREWVQAILGRSRIIVRRPPLRQVSEPAEHAGTHSPDSEWISLPIGPSVNRPSPETPSRISRTSVPISQQPLPRSVPTSRPSPIPAQLSQPPLRSVPQAPPPVPRESVPVTMPATTGPSIPGRPMTLGERVTASDAFAEQRRISRSAISDEQVTALINGLDARDGRLSVTEAGALINEPVDRTGLLMGAAKRLLNVDGYDVLTLKDGDQTVDLNLRLLMEQFFDEEVEP
ncbi:hypothetical protein [Streptosporangium minutum]|uniref:Alkaline phosphatase-like protein PglZ C-terminal domain-containing protein n=1 Tax=Streptosporangium minutum TaxID=569862 RepID=A0A243RC46_9ACTN|nr:hypothetical protein [Streptosporangium minutum]OUC91526.1 hypothetical protein CA984_33365 [Streptosporangium minutum]